MHGPFACAFSRSRRSFSILGSRSCAKSLAQRLARGAGVVRCGVDSCGVGGDRRGAARHAVRVAARVWGRGSPSRAFARSQALPAFLPLPVSWQGSHSSVLSAVARIVDTGPSTRHRSHILGIAVRYSEQQLVFSILLLVNKIWLGLRMLNQSA